MISTAPGARETPSSTDTATPVARHGRMHLLMLFATFCWASNIIAGKEALLGFGALALAQVRVTGSALVLGILFLIWRRPRPFHLDAREWLFLTWVALFGITLNQLLFIGGLSRSSVAHTALIVALGPVMVLALSCLLRMEALTALKFVGMMISFVGVGVLTFGKDANGSGATVIGDLILLAGTATFSYYTVLVKDLTNRHDALTLNTLIFALGALLMTPFAGLSILKVRWSVVSPHAWWGLVFMIVFGSVAAYLIQVIALTELTAARVAAFSYLQPVIATGLGFWLLRESLTRRVIFGGVLILLGVYLTERENGDEKQAQKVANELA